MGECYGGERLHSGEILGWGGLLGGEAWCGGVLRWGRLYIGVVWEGEEYTTFLWYFCVWDGCAECGMDSRVPLSMEGVECWMECRVMLWTLVCVQCVVCGGRIRAVGNEGYFDVLEGSGKEI